MQEDKFIDITLEYGQGHYDLTERKINKEKIKVNENGKEKIISKETLIETDNLSKIYDIYPTCKKNLLNYHIHKIVYSLNTEQKIQSFKIIYKNRNNGQEMVLDSENSHLQNEKPEEFVLQDMEEIIDVYFYYDKKGDEVGDLTTICLTTNRGTVKYIGGKQSDNIFKDRNLETKEKVVLSFGITSSKKNGVTSMYCYYIDKKKYGVIQYLGLIQLKAKLSKNKDFADSIEAKKASLDEKNKLIAEVCSLPNTAFFPIANYIMSN